MANIATEEDPCLCVSGMVLSLQGNAITVSRQLFERGVTNPETLREYIFKTWGKRTCTFAVGALWSTQTILLRQWLESGGIHPELHIRIVTIPPEQLFPTL
jgi:ABC-type nitrate/sulfonate/bicarbonate transport system substrate-binding protein